MHPANLLPGASRSFSISGHTFSAEEVATNSNHHAIVAWLVSSRQWSTPLHHLTVLTATRALALLPAGADVRAAAAAGGPTPLSLARAKPAAGAVPDGSPAGLVLAAAHAHGARRRMSSSPRWRVHTR